MRSAGWMMAMVGGWMVMGNVRGGFGGLFIRGGFGGLTTPFPNPFSFPWNVRGGFGGLFIRGRFGRFVRRSVRGRFGRFTTFRG